MSEPFEIGGEGGDDIRAAEYVLGLMEASERAAIERELTTNTELAEKVRYWEAHFAAFNAQYAEVLPPADLLGRIEGRLFGQAMQSRWYDSLLLWRSIAGATVAAAVFAIGLNVLAPTPEPTDPVPSLVTALETLEGDIEVVALYDPQTTSLRLNVGGSPAAAGQDYELWFIQGESDPVSMGTISVGTGMTLAVDAALAANFGEGIALAVSLEPEGGSPVDAPTGPILAIGTVAAI